MLGRIILPVALIALFFAPWFSETQESAVMGEETTVSYSGYDIIKPTISCALKGTYSAVGECAPKSGIRGYLLLGVVGLAAAAAVVHLLGFASIIRKFGSSLAALAGLAAIGGAGWIGWDTFSAVGQEGIDLGLYGTGAAALITAVAGWLGMREDAG